MADWGTVSGSTIVSGSIGIPLLGAWVADVVLRQSVTLPTRISLTIGNLTMAGAVYRQSAFAGLLEARLVGGAGGWSQNVEARAYYNPGGVLLSTVLGDAGIEVGETVIVQADSVIGNLFVRFAQKAKRVLRFGGPSWYVDTSGNTQVGPRPSPQITSAFTTEAFHGGSGHLSIATEDPGSWMPGAVFSSPTVPVAQTIGSVRHSLDGNGKARMEIMTQ